VPVVYANNLEAKLFTFSLKIYSEILLIFIEMTAILHFGFGEYFMVECPGLLN
jgi:hypothetical protein